MNRNMVKLGDHSFVTKLAGFEHTKYIQHNATHETNDVPLIIGRNIKNGKVIYEFDWYIPNKISDALPRSVLNKRCILIPYVGNLGELAIFKNEFKCHLGSNVAKVELTDNVFDLDYLFYYLRTSYGQNQLLRDKQGSVQANITMEAIRDTKIVLQDKADQKKIAAVLSALDAKIELNQRINAELESMAKTLYDYWFVQFEFPNEKGKPYKSSGGKMVWNEELKREIPLGWEVENIEKCCDIIDCLHSKKPDYEFEDERYYLLQLENIRDDGLLDLSNKYFVPKSVYKTWISRIEVTEDDILITNAGRVAATAQVPKDIKAGIGRNITAIRPNSVSPTYLFLSFRGIDIRRQIKWNTDSGAFFSSFNVKGIKKLFILRPKDDIEKQFEKTVKSIRRKRELNNIESQMLTELRDWLLPMLMNGQVKVTQTSEVSKTSEV